MSETLPVLNAFLLVALFAVYSPRNCKAEDTVSLFDGKSLAGWHAEGGKIESWKAADGILSCIAPGGGWLTTDKEYADFILSLDWRIPEAGNSGVGLRYPSDTHVSETGMEIQILDDNAEQHRNIKPAQHTGSIYYQVAAKQGAANPPGQWNHYEITCRGALVIVNLNSKEVVRANLEEHTSGEGGLTPLRARPRSGHIGVQSHDTGVDYRNIRIKPL
ncbi:MAG: hypothetical protein A2Z86_12290 [Candidatus Glassbacteria bacterium GWA2_58_10]|uniref:3-keto-alpha-glucoside-1,2-lyase/3-keto-2-hydroxy-glucal hydratase domain-containing protein n=1 Tax=Candidatus Glassbacteria bacterium GWA2_58_10 TaxID=1817865 RepID=A0A1F5YGC0_9BACT|nr:MAG: hypothetical protein A2Z86_12290 [Candidatus Glassbacteria bacterium GWA2_58_10]